MYEAISTNRALNIAVLKACENTEISALIHLVLKSQQETNENVHSLQKAVASLREQVQDLAEHCKDNAEVKRLLLEFRRSKVWLSREAV
jgi:predicted transcriptional regulator